MLALTVKQLIATELGTMLHLRLREIGRLSVLLDGLERLPQQHALHHALTQATVLLVRVMAPVPYVLLEGLVLTTEEPHLVVLVVGVGVLLALADLELVSAVDGVSKSDW